MSNKIMTDVEKDLQRQILELEYQVKWLLLASKNLIDKKTAQECGKRICEIVEQYGSQEVSTDQAATQATAPNTSAPTEQQLANAEIVKTLQALIDAQYKTISRLRGEMEELHSQIDTLKKDMKAGGK